MFEDRPGRGGGLGGWVGDYASALGSRRHWDQSAGELSLQGRRDSSQVAAAPKRELLWNRSSAWSTA